MSIFDKLRKQQHHRAELAFSDERYDRRMTMHQQNPQERNWYLHEAHEDHIWGQRRMRASKKRGFL
jgi:hypothetical protein